MKGNMKEIRLKGDQVYLVRDEKAAARDVATGHIVVQGEKHVIAFPGDREYEQAGSIIREGFDAWIRTFTGFEPQWM